ncbi:MAG: hypothetical protein DRQ59_11335 [Gammaproteobacteria bacterium]|nr:MAG: hypothetical protein DRQ59_11335 [Gammaproteobacteria bacterium]
MTISSCEVWPASTGATVGLIACATGSRASIKSRCIISSFRHITSLKSVWCADDRNKAITDAKNSRFEGLPPGDCARAAIIDRGYLVGNQVGIRGAPALIKSNGEKIEGYVPYLELIPQLLQ